MLNDIIFNEDKSAYFDWNIVLVKADIPLPLPKTSGVDIKGADGLLDLTEVSGDVKYQNRTCKLHFELMNTDNYDDLKSEISNYLHGKNITFIKTNDSNFYYYGRASVNEWECSKQTGRFVITVNAEPYKYEVNMSTQTVIVNNVTEIVIIPNLRKRVCPILEVTGTVKMTFNGNEYTLNSGVQQIVNFTLNEGDNTVKFSGNGTVKITYRRCSL